MQMSMQHRFGTENHASKSNVGLLMEDYWRVFILYIFSLELYRI